MLNIPRILAGLLLSTLIGLIAYRRGSLSRSGMLGAILTGTATFGFGGWTWGVLLIVFFASSSLLSRFKEARKQQIAGEKFEKGGRRDLLQALANGGAAGGLALIYALLGEPPLLLAAGVGALATVTADTWATELGVLSRTPPRLVLSGQQVAPGTSGAITAAGSLAGLAGAILIGVAALLLHGWETSQWLPGLIVVAALGGPIGSLSDSLLGATLQAIYRGPDGGETEKTHGRDGRPNVPLRGLRWMNNDAVNFISSLTGALVGAACWLALP